MKKVLLTFLTGIFCAAVFAEGMDLNYIVTQDTYKYTSIYEDAKRQSIKKGSLINARTHGYDDALFISEIPEIDTAVLLNTLDEEFFVPVYYAKPQNTVDLLPENLITHDGSKRVRNLIPFFYLKVLETGNLDIDVLSKYEPFYPHDKKVINLQDGMWSAAGVSCNLSNCGIFFYSGNYILFKNITKKSDSLYECEGISRGNYENEDPIWASLLRNTLEDETEKFIIEIDGDYINISSATQDKPIITLVYVSDSTMNELEHLFRTNKCDVSRVTLPRHADGRTDNDKNSASDSRIKKYMYMYVKENLKLRASEDTSSNVLAVMAPLTTVKILEIGKEEIIDGIKSNWVKVEVYWGRDKDGNDIVDPVGWCYGGYLE